MRDVTVFLRSTPRSSHEGLISLPVFYGRDTFCVAVRE